MEEDDEKAPPDSDDDQADDDADDTDGDDDTDVGDDDTDVGDDEDEDDDSQPLDAGTKPDAKAPIDASKPVDSGKPAEGDASKPTDVDSGKPSTDPDASTNDPEPDAGPGDEEKPTSNAFCLDDITDYDKVGPFKFTQKTAGKVKFWVPTLPAGCKVPVIHLANGTTAKCSDYQGAIDRLASHGFLTACYEDPRTGAGTYGMEAFEAALSMFPDMADMKFGSTGHSQGGQAAIVTTAMADVKWGDKAVIAGLAMEPASGYGEQPTGGWKAQYAKVKSPMFMFSGDSGLGFSNSSLLGMSKGDGLVAISWVNEGFEALPKSIEAYHWLAAGATHIPTPVPEEQQISIPWFRWKLLGDKKACEYFKKMPGTKWKVQKEQNVKGCE